MALSGDQLQGFRNGDRVRVCEPEGEYSGCRGTVVEAPESPGQQVELPLGYMVAIDGENGDDDVEIKIGDILPGEAFGGIALLSTDAFLA